MGASTTRAVLIRLIGSSAAPAISLLSAPILARGLGVDGRGEVGAATMPLILATSALSLGLPDAATYFVARRHSPVHAIYRTAARWTVLAGLIGMALIIGLSPILAAGKSKLAVIMALCSVALIPTLLLGVARGVAAAQRQWMRLTIENLLASGLRLAALACLLATGHLTPFSGSLCIAASTVLGGLAYVGSWPKSEKHELTPGPPLLSYGMKSWLGTITGVVVTYFDQALMTPLSGTYELGIYAVAVSISQVSLVFNSTVAGVVLAHEASAPDPIRIARASRISTGVTVLICLTVGIVSIPLLPAIFGHDFARSLPVLHVLLLGVILGNPGSVVGAGLIALGRPEMRSISVAIAALVNVALVFVLVPSYGAAGAAWATVAGSTIASTLNMYWMSRTYSVPARSYWRYEIADFKRSLSSADRS